MADVDIEALKIVKNSLSEFSIEITDNIMKTKKKLDMEEIYCLEKIRMTREYGLSVRTAQCVAENEVEKAEEEQREAETESAYHNGRMIEEEALSASLESRISSAEADLADALSAQDYDKGSFLQESIQGEISSLKAQLAASRNEYGIARSRKNEADEKARIAGNRASSARQKAAELHRIANLIAFKESRLLDAYKSFKNDKDAYFSFAGAFKKNSVGGAEINVSSLEMAIQIISDYMNVNI